MTLMIMELDMSITTTSPLSMFVEQSANLLDIERYLFSYDSWHLLFNICCFQEGGFPLTEISVYY